MLPSGGLLSAGVEVVGCTHSYLCGPLRIRRRCAGKSAGYTRAQCDHRESTQPANNWRCLRPVLGQAAAAELATQHACCAHQATPPAAAAAVATQACTHGATAAVENRRRRRHLRRCCVCCCCCFTSCLPWRLRVRAQRPPAADPGAHPVHLLCVCVCVCVWGGGGTDAAHESAAVACVARGRLALRATPIPHTTAFNARARRAPRATTAPSAM
jgi:hypothetical protein